LRDGRQRRQWRLQRSVCGADRRDSQFIVLDTSNTPGGVIKPGDIRQIKYADMYRKLDALSQQAGYNIGVNHHPILGFAAKEDKNGKISLNPGNGGLQSVFGAINPLYLPPRVNAMLSGHVHVWEEISFSSPHPTQFVAGFPALPKISCRCRKPCRPARPRRPEPSSNTSVPGSTASVT